MPKFSVIIPLYNKETLVKNTLESVFKQSYVDYEIIIVNDGSTDDSLEVIKKLKTEKIKIYETKNYGVSAARNFGIQQANGDYLAFLDADDYWYPNYLEEINLLIKKHSKEFVFSTAINLQNNKINYPASYSIPDFNHQVINYFKGSKIQSLLSSSSTVIHQSVLDTTGLFDSNLISGEDTDLWIRIGLQYNIVFSKKICVNYINIENSLSNTHFDSNTKCRFENYEEIEKTNIDLKKFLNINRFSLAILSKRAKDYKNYLYFKSKIDLKYLNWKQIILLRLNSRTLNILNGFNIYLKSKNIFLLIFK